MMKQENDKRHRVSLKELAERLGVSIATVSRALNGSPEISAEMTARVKKVAKELNYRPNPFAQSLRTKTPMVIGVVVPNLVTHYFASVLDGIEQEAAVGGYSVISANSHESIEQERRAVDEFFTMRVVGIIACLSQDTTDYSHFLALQEAGTPVVFFGRTCMNDSFSSVTANGDKAAREAVEHLISAGRRRIAYVGGPNHLDMARRRKHGYLEALRNHSIPIDRDIISNGKIDFDSAKAIVTKMLTLADPPDAILAFNDIITYASMAAIRLAGRKVPDEVALIGFTDDNHAEYMTPAITAIEDQSSLMGITACRLLKSHIAGEKEVKNVIVPQKLVIRDSG